MLFPSANLHCAFSAGLGRCFWPPICATAITDNIRTLHNRKAVHFCMSSPFIQQTAFSSQFSVLSSQFSVLSSQFSVLSSQFSVLRIGRRFRHCVSAEC